MGDEAPDDKPEVDPEALEGVTEASISAGVKKQLEQYEPINGHTSLTVDLEGLSPEEKVERLEAVRDAAWADAERGVLQRYEQHLTEETFGE